MEFVRGYRLDDYEAVKALYMQNDLFGGQFDEARDAPERLAAAVAEDRQSILVFERGGVIWGTVSLIENARVAWLFRFAVAEGEQAGEVAKALYGVACRTLAERGHGQVLVYSPAGYEELTRRYLELGLTHGQDYTCFWSELRQE